MKILLQILAWAWMLLILSVSFSEAKDETMVRAEGRSVKEQALVPYGALAAPSPQHVVIEYNDFLHMLAMKEHADKTNNKLSAENAVLVKLKDEQGAVISLQQEDIRACRDIVKSHEQLGETEAQISKAVEEELRNGIETEKRLGRYKSEAFYATGIIAAIVYLTRR